MLLIPWGVIAQSFDQAEIDMFHMLRQQSNQLARYEYLVKVMPHLSPSDQVMAGQFRAFSLDELGLYNQAVLSFPLSSEQPAGLVLPSPDEWKSADAADVITKLAADHRIVLINEAHHNAHTRALTLALLPRLRELGFTYFAAEALGEDDPNTSKSPCMARLSAKRSDWASSSYPMTVLISTRRGAMRRKRRTSFRMYLPRTPMRDFLCMPAMHISTKPAGVSAASSRWPNNWRN
jgi:hypothetical protein